MARSFSKSLAAAAAAATLLATGAAHADTFVLAFTGDGISGDVFATTDASNHVVSINGWLTDTAISPTAFSVTGVSGYAGADNLLAAGSPYVTYAGLSFSTTIAGNDFNIYDNGGASFSLLTESTNPVGYGVPSNVSLTVSAVPEPANLAMMLAGAMGLFAVARRRAAR